VSRRGLLGAAGAFVVLGLLALAMLRRPEPAERAAARARPAARLGPHDFDTLEVRRTPSREGWTTLRRTPTEVRLTAPVAYPADPAAGAAAFAAIEKLDFLDLVTDRPARHADSQVDAAKGIRVIATKRAKTGDIAVLDLVIGKSVADYGTLVRLDAHDEVWQVAGDLREVFDKGPSDWRDRAVTTFQPSDVQGIEIAAPDGSRIALRKTGTKTNFKRDDWEVVSSTVAIGHLDQLAPNQLVETMSSLRASTFADGAAPASAGLDPPALRVTVALAGWPSVTLLVGQRGSDNETYVRNPEVPQLFLVKDFNMERIARRPIQFRDKTLCDMSAADIAAFSVANGSDSYALVKRDGAWIAVRPAGLDTAKLAPLVNVFRSWTAPAIVEKAAVNALPPATIVINATSAKSKATSCTIRVAGESADQRSYYVSTPASKDVYAVPKWMIDRVAMRLDALAKNP
jgi:hypothetical protein